MRKSVLCSKRRVEVTPTGGGDLHNNVCGLIFNCVIMFQIGIRREEKRYARFSAWSFLSRRKSEESSLCECSSHSEKLSVIGFNLQNGFLELEFSQKTVKTRPCERLCLDVVVAFSFFRVCWRYTCIIIFCKPISRITHVRVKRTNTYINDHERLRHNDS
jgi:hypothetical protein